MLSETHSITTCELCFIAKRFNKWHTARRNTEEEKNSFDKLLFFEWTSFVEPNTFKNSINMMRWGVVVRIILFYFFSALVSFVYLFGWFFLSSVIIYFFFRLLNGKQFENENYNNESSREWRFIPIFLSGYLFFFYVCIYLVQNKCFVYGGIS